MNATAKHLNRSDPYLPTKEFVRHSMNWRFDGDDVVVAVAVVEGGNGDEDDDVDENEDDVRPCNQVNWED